MILEFRCVSGGMHPIVGAVWYRIPSSLGGEHDRYSRYLCSALSMTMHTIKDCEEALQLIDFVKSGKSVEEEFGWNDTLVTFRSGIAQVDILIEEQQGTLDGRFNLDEFRKAVSAWREFLLMPESLESTLRVDIA